MAIVPDRRISQNFRLYEFLESQTAARHPEIQQAQYSIDGEKLDNLLYLVGRCIQPIRTLLDVPLSVSSGYRSEALNEKVGGSATSQHVLAQAADMSLSGAIMYSQKESVQRVRGIISNMVLSQTGGYIRENVNANFYLFATFVLYLDFLDVDQLIHEYGTDGAPAWVHVSASKSKDRRQILVKRSGERYVELSPREALMLGC